MPARRPHPLPALRHAASSRTQERGARPAPLGAAPAWPGKGKRGARRGGVCSRLRAVQMSQGSVTPVPGTRASAPRLRAATSRVPRAKDSRLLPVTKSNRPAAAAQRSPLRGAGLSFTPTPGCSEASSPPAPLPAVPNGDNPPLCRSTSPTWEQGSPSPALPALARVTGCRGQAARSCACPPWSRTPQNTVREVIFHREQIDSIKLTLASVPPPYRVFAQLSRPRGAAGGGERADGIAGRSRMLGKGERQAGAAGRGKPETKRAGTDMGIRVAGPSRLPRGT